MNEKFKVMNRIENIVDDLDDILEIPETDSNIANWDVKNNNQIKNEKSSFFNNIKPSHIGETSNNKNNLNNNQPENIKQISTGNTPIPISTQIQRNSTNTAKNNNSNINNIFNSFSNSSLIGGAGVLNNPIQFSNNKANNLVNIKQYSSPRDSNKNNIDLQRLPGTQYSNKDRKKSPLRFNSVFGILISNDHKDNKDNKDSMNDHIKITVNGKANSNSNLVIISNHSNTSTIKSLNGNINSTSSSCSSNSYLFKEYSYNEDPNRKFRNTMEDFIKIVDNYMDSNGSSSAKGFFSLYDGHGGSDPVKYAKERMPEILAKLLEKNENVEQCLKSAFLKVDEELKFTDSDNTGCTACVVYLTYENSKRFAYSANVGDSRSILISSKEVLRITTDHKCTDQLEVDRIKRSGGLVFNGRVFGQLVLTRALGDHALKQYGVISTPYVTKVELSDLHKYIIMASDGIWDVINDEDLLPVSKSIQSAEEFSKYLIKTALDKGSKDNMSCIVIKLN